MSLRTTQQIDKLLVGQIFPRDSNQNFISTGQILVTDNQGRANWTSLSTIGANYAQFTSLSTNEGVIVADEQQTTLNFREGAGINLQIISNALYLNTTAFTAIDIDGGNSLLSSNISNNVINPRLRFVNGNYTKIRGDPGTNSIFIDVDLLSTTTGARAAYTTLIIQNNSSYAQPPASESVILNAIVSDASLTLIGIDDLQISNANFSPSCNVLYIGLSTITAAKFSTLYTSAFEGLSNLSVSIDLINSRQINTQGVTCNQFFPVSTQVWRTSTTFSAFYNFTFNPLRTLVTSAVTDIESNYSTLSSYIYLNNLYATGISNAGVTISNNLTTVSNAGVTTSNNLTTVSNAAGTNSTFIDNAYSTLSSYIRQNVGIFSLSSLTLSTLLVSSIINASTISTTGNLSVGGRTNLNQTFITGGLSADTVTSVFFGDGSHLTGISSGGGGVAYSEFYPVSTTAIQASTLTTIFYSTLSSYIKSINTGGSISIIPPILSTTFLSTGFLSASNISAITMSTNYGFFSTISAGTIYGRFAGDASLLTSIPNTGAILTVSNNVTTVSNLLNAVSTNVTTVSTNLNSLSNNVTTVSTNLNTLSNSVSYLLSVSNTSAITTSTSYGFFSTISAGTIYARFVGDGSGLTGIATGVSIIPPILSTTFLSTGFLSARNISSLTMSTNYGFFSTISAGTIFAKFVGDGTGLTGLPSGGISIVPPVLSTTLLSTGILTARNISTAVISTNAGFASSFFINNLTTSTVTALLGSFSSISVGQAYISSLTVDSLFIGNDIGFTNMGDVIATSLSTILVTTGNLVAINVSVASASTNYGFFSTISAGTIYARFVGDGSGLTGITSGGISTVPPILSTTFLSTGFLSARNISSLTMSTNYGFFSTISAGTIYGRFAGDASLLTAIPNNGAVLTVSNNITTVSNLLNSVSTSVITVSTNVNTISNLLNSVSTNVTTVSTNLNTVSNLLNSVSTNVTTVSTNLNTVSNLLNSVSTNVTTVSTNLNTVSNLLNSVSTNVTTVSTNLNTVSNRVNYLLTVSNTSAITTSTSYGFFSTISAGTIYARFVGDGSGLTGIASGGISTVPPILSTTFLSTGFLSASNISSITMSTNYGFFSTISAGTIYGRFAGDASLLTSIPNNGAVLTVSNNVTTVSNLLNSVSTSVITVSTNVNTISNLLNSVSTNVTTVSTNLNTVSNLLNSVSTNVTTVSTNLNTVSNLLNSVSTNVTTVSTNVNTVSNNVTTVSNLLNSVSTSVITVSTNLNTVSNSVTTVSNLLNSVSTSVITVSTNVNTVSNLLNSVSTNVTTVSTNLNTISNRVNYLLTVSNTSAITTSTSYGFFSTISAGTIYARFVGDGSGLTGIASGGISIVPPVLSTTFLSTGFLSASNISAITTSTNYGFFSTISAGTIYGRFAGDASLLTSIPNNGAVLTVSNNVTTVSNLLNSVSSSVITVSTNLNTVSNLLNSVSTNVTTVSTNVNTISNLLNSVSTSVIIVSTNLNTVSNRVNYLLTVSNTSSITTSTSFGFFSTISAGTIYGRFAGDASLLTSIPNNGAVLTVSNNVTTVSNLLNAVSTNVTTVSTNLNTVSNRLDYLLTVSNTSSITTSTSYGFFSTISAGTIYGRFVGDASLLTSIPNNGAVLTVSNNVTTVSNLLNSVSTSVITVSTNVNTISNLLNSVSTSVITVSTNVNTISNLLNSVSTSVTTVSTNVNTISNLLNSVSTSVITVSTNLNTVSNRVNYLLTVSNTSAITTSTSYGFFSTISAGAIYARFIGDGSQLTGIPGVGSFVVPPILSTNILSTGILTASNISTISFSTSRGFASSFGINNLTTSTTFGLLGIFSTISTTQLVVSSLTVNSLMIGGTLGYVNMGDIVTTSLSTLIINAGSIVATGISTVLLSTSYGFFSTISTGSIYGRFIGDGSGLTGIASGGISIVPPVLSTTFLSTGFLSASNISAITTSTNYGFFSTISAGTIYGRFAGDASLLTSIPNNGAVLTVSNNVTTVSNLLNSVSTSVITVSTNLNTVSNLLNSVSTNVTTVSTNLNTVSNLLNSVSTSVITVSTNLNTVSNLLNSVSTSVITVSTNVNTVSNLLNSVSTSVTTVSTNLNTVSNRVNYLLTVSNTSAITTSTSYGFFSTISAGTIYGRFVGDASLLTSIPNNGAVLTVSNNVTTVSNLLNSVSTSVITVSTNLNTVSNLLNSVSTNVTTVSTNVNTISNLLNSVSTNVTTVSTNVNTVSNRVNYLLTVSNTSAITTSTSYGFFSTLSSGSIYGRFIGDASLLISIPNNGAVLTVSNNVTTVSNLVNYLLTVSNTSAITTSTSYGFFSTLSSGSIYGRFIGDASLLTAIPNTGAVLTVSNNVTTVSNLVNYLLTVSNTSAITTSTSYGFFSTLSSGSIYGRFIGDASLLTAIPNTGAVLTVSNNVTTVSNLLNAVSTNVTTVSTNLNTVSNLLNSVSTNVTTVSTNLNTVSNLLNAVSTNVTTVSTNLNTVSNLVNAVSTNVTTVSTNLNTVSNLLNAVSTNVTTVSTNLNTISNLLNSVSTNVTTVSTNLNTVSNSVNYLLTVSNTSSLTTSTSFGFFSTLSSGAIYGRFIGDGSLLTGLRFSYSSPPVLSTTFLSTGFLTASNISAITMSTNYGFFSTISAGTIFAKFVGDGSGLTGLASGGISIVPPVLSTTLLSTGILTASNISTTVISTNAGFASSFFINRLTTSTVSALLGSFSSLSVSQVYVSSLTVDNLTIGNDNGFINMGDVIAASLSTILVTAGSISTTYGWFSTISAGTVYGRFIGDGSGLTGITGGSGGIAVVPPILSTTFLSTGFLSARNISAITMSTNYGFFSTISTGSIFGRYVGDGSGLTNLPTSSLSLSTGNISISTITIIDTVNNSTGTIYERSSLLYFDTFVIGGGYVWTSQLLRAN